MGCINACICDGRCSESCYEPEHYCGEAEDVYDELYGNYKSKEWEKYVKAQEEEYYKYLKAEEDEYYAGIAKYTLADENSNDFEKEQAREYLMKMGETKEELEKLEEDE